MDRYAVVGNPVAHSRSPEIHAAFAAQTGQRLSYEKLLAPLDNFAGTVDAFFAAGGAGLNVTVPFKEAAYGWVDERDEYAGAAGAVNTIVRRGAIFRGCNTDGLGLVADLERNLGVVLRNARILLLGAGGAVRGVLGPLLGCAPAAIDIANRTLDRAQAIVDRLEDPRVAVRRLDALTGRYDLVVNGTAAGLDGASLAIDPARIARAFVYDMAYGEAAQGFLSWAAGAGAVRAVDGLGMLVEQAAVAFHLWRGVRPDTGPVIAALRRS